MDKDPVIESIKKANSVKSDISTARMAMSCMDYASLNGEETVDQIQLLCQNAITEKVGGVCVYSPHVRMVSDYLKETDIAIATVINFPLGDKTNEGDIATYDNTYDAVCNAITDGATEIDIVIDYNDFTEENAKELLRACRKACDEGNAKMKVILEVENGNPAADLPTRCELAINEGADMIKTSTGKYPEAMTDHEKMECAVIMMSAIKQSHRDVGLKISGGVNDTNYAPYLALVESEMGSDFMTPQTFRFGASGLYNDLHLALEIKGATIGHVVKHGTLGY